MICLFPDLITYHKKKYSRKIRGKTQTPYKLPKLTDVKNILVLYLRMLIRAAKLKICYLYTALSTG